MSSGFSLLSCVLSFVAGASVSLGAFYAWHRRRKSPELPSSPHYITAKQNPYVTVPMKEYHHHRAAAKRTPSFNGRTSAQASAAQQHNTGGGGATLPRLFGGGKSADYETATIKRNSHGLVNGHARANRHDLEQERFF